MLRDLLPKISPDQPVLIAGPTAAGKSALALGIAESQGGVVVNADASQVYSCWRVLTARPSAEEEARASHALYGHVSYNAPYSTGHWLRDVTPLLAGARPIIVGGTGLYFSALTEGLADIPATPAAVRSEADALSLETLIDGVNQDTLSRIDTANRARVQRAWEVERATGRALHLWQEEKSDPLLSAEDCAKVVIEASVDWLNPRIETRFKKMLHNGGLAEAERMKDLYDPSLPAFRAIGVREALDVLEKRTTEGEAIVQASIATRQYAKRQRTWFRARMSDWLRIDARDLE